MPYQLLAVGDMHLGRRPSRIPGSLSARAAELGPAAAWGRTVGWAVEHGVDAVLLAGDVVEGEEDFYEGYRQLHEGVARLAAAGITVLGVAGNHDVHVLPRLAAHVPGFTLLGAEGTWEAHELEGGGEEITVWGWSFPQRVVSTSPLRGRRLERGPGVNIGLLHCDLDRPASPYAPVASAEIDGAGLDGWLLGHIHAPSPLSLDRPIGYLGSLTGLDPGERGRRGPWLVTVDGRRIRSIEPLALAPLRWELIDVDVTDIPSVDLVRDALLESVRRLDRSIDDDGAPAGKGASAVGVRVRFVGRTPFGGQLARLLSDDDCGHIYGRSRHYFVEDVRVDVRPEIALEEIARRPEPPGHLARRLALLDEDPSNPDRQRLLAAARQALEPAVRDRAWQPLDDDGLEDDVLVDLLRRAGLRLLEAMRAQRTGDGGAA